MNFALILFVLLVITFVAWLLERFWLRPQRLRDADAALGEFDRTTAPGLLLAQGATAVELERVALREKYVSQPVLVEYTAGLFPVIFVVFFLRSFLYEPFKIPSGSMIPTLRIGDLILVNKFVYGVRLPIVNQKVIEFGEPQRGDVVVFRFPRDPSVDYIKRVVGLPGDTVSYLNKHLSINGVEVALAAAGEFYDSDRLSYSAQYSETLGTVEHKILTELEKPSFIAPIDRFRFMENCRYSTGGVVCTVPPGHYFMMGDNRENSFDSRFWGFVPEQNLVGRAFFVWMNFGDLSRIGRFR
ncbi:MAG: signal peptidase I [Burkholderiaceae bacterium]|nr:signal peptidase I [Burkholderiaceae bacterium]